IPYPVSNVGWHTKLVNSPFGVFGTRTRVGLRALGLVRAVWLLVGWKYTDRRHRPRRLASRWPASLLSPRKKVRWNAAKRRGRARDRFLKTAAYELHKAPAFGSRADIGISADTRSDNHLPLRSL